MELSRIAGLLRQAREERGITIEQAATAAGVPLRYARLLEADPATGVGISDELYLVPFFRRYATFVGLNAEQLLPDFLGHVQEVPGGAGAPPSFSYPSRGGGVRKLLTAGAAVAAAVFLIARQSPQQSPILDEPWEEPGAQETSLPDGSEPAAVGDLAAASAPAEVAAPGSAPAAGTLVAATAAPAPETSGAPLASAGTAASPVPSVTAAGATVGGSPIASVAPVADAAATAGGERPAGARELRIVAAEETWFSLAIDGAEKHEFLLHPGESRTWNGHESFTLTVGNAGGITLTLDGRELPRLGVSGEVVRNVRLPGDGA